MKTLWIANWVGFAILLGMLVGLGSYTFLHAKGYSYLTNNAEACANCHIMREQFEAWTRSSHQGFAVCNTCHTPPGLVAKYVTKARNGFWHSFYFTTGRFPEPIRIRERNLSTVETACRTCHSEVTQAIDSAPDRSRPLSCTACHDSVGHLR